MVQPAPRSARRDPLVVASVAFLAANLLHTLDHLRQGLDGLSWEILTAGSTLTLLAAVTLVLALRRDPRTAPIAATVGISGAVGIAASHLAPHWSALSDPYAEIHADAISWAAVAVEIGAALALAAVAVAALRATGGARRRTASSPC